MSIWKVSFCAMEMKLQEAWSPLANTLPAFRELHRNGQHNETWNNRREPAEHIPLSNTPLPNTSHVFENIPPP